MNDLPNQPQPQEPKKKYLFYRILGYIMNFISIFFLFVTLMSFAVTGFQPRLLLFLFIFVAILIYTNLSTVFGRHVMVRGNNLRIKIKDWIKVNAIVTVLFSGFSLYSIVVVLSNKSYIQKMIDMYANVQGVTDEMLQQMIPVVRGVFIGFGVCMLIFIVHVIFTFRYLKRFKQYFRNEIEQP